MIRSILIVNGGANLGATTPAWGRLTKVTLRLSLQSPHLSIKAFPTIDIPDFAVITGRNGSGKSHLLDAIVQGRVVCDKDNIRVNVNPSEIRSYSWANMVPQDPGVFSSENSRNEKIQILQHAKTILLNNNIILALRQNAQQYQLNNLTDQQLIRSSAADLDELSDTTNGTVFTNIRDNVFLNNEQQVKNINLNFGVVIDTVRRQGQSIFSLTETELISAGFPNYGRTDLFQQSFARLFVEYRDIYVRNELHDNAFRKQRRKSPALTDEDFKAKYGPAPWDFVNTSLREAGLDFSIDIPSLDDYGSYQPKLTKISSGDEVQFSNLSSGEKILMSFAFCLYYATDDRQLSLFPKILLLDEIDAPLHPAMTKGLIQTISDILVKKYLISVIMTTHSPSTVALYTGDDVCIMQDGKRGLKITNKGMALNLLTEGVPTLSLSYSGRRQVFVESNADAETYPIIYDILKRDIQNERSLEFISTGIKDATGVDRNTGCTMVNKLVKELGEAGNMSVFGVLDWDGIHVSTKRIVVLAEGERNGLENVLLDPLIISAFICHSCRAEMIKLDIPGNTSYINFVSWHQAQLQPIVTKLCEIVLGRSSSDTVVVEYIGGIRLSVEKEYLIADDHLIEQKLINAFPSLKAFSKGAGKLMQKIASAVINDKPDWLPVVMRAVFTILLEKDSH